MRKVESSSPGTSILKFNLFQFSKWVCLDKNNNLGIAVALLVLNDWTMLTLRDIPSSFMAYTWLCSSHFNTAWTPNITSLRRSTKQLQLKVPSGQSSNQMPMQDGGIPSKYWNVAALFVIMPANYFILE